MEDLQKHMRTTSVNKVSLHWLTQTNTVDGDTCGGIRLSQKTTEFLPNLFGNTSLTYGKWITFSAFWNHCYRQ